MGDEFCDGVDNDGDGAIDEDPGSCTLRFLFVPVCWNGTDAQFDELADHQADVFLQETGLGACPSNFYIEKLPPSQLNIPCPATGSCISVSGLKTAVDAAYTGRLSDFDLIGGFTDQDLCNEVAGATNAAGVFWAEPHDVVMAHEFGHVIGLDDEYCSTVAGGHTACNTPSSLNPLRAEFGCDPAVSSCCDESFRDPEADPNQFADDGTACGGAYARCCAGNLNRESDVGRCIMTNATAPGPRGWCEACFQRWQDIGATCATRHGGNERLLVVRGQVDPGQELHILGVTREDGRLFAPTNLPLTDGFEALDENGVRLASATVSHAGEYGGSGPFEVEAKLALPASVGDAAKITVRAIHQGQAVSQTTFNGAAPVANAGPDQTVECTSPAGTPVILSGTSSSDADGDSLQFTWTGEGSTLGTESELLFEAPMGSTVVGLTVDDGASHAVDGAVITVVDTTPPVLSAPGPVALTACDPNAAVFEIPAPEAVDSCSDLVVTGRIAESNGVTIPSTATTGSSFHLGAGTHTIQWTAIDTFGNQSSVTQRVVVAPAFAAAQELQIGDRAIVSSATGVPAAVALVGSGQCTIGVEARVGDVACEGGVELRDRSVVLDEVIATGAVTRRSEVTVARIIQSAPLVMDPPAVPPVPSAPNRADIRVSPDAAASASPGRYAQVVVGSRSTLMLNAGTYVIDQLQLESGSTIGSALGPVQIFVTGSWIHRGTFSFSPEIIYTSTTDLQLESHFRGALLAPNARVFVGSTATGRVYAATLWAQPGATLTCAVN